MFTYSDGSTKYEGAVLAYPVYGNGAFGDYEAQYASVWTGERIERVQVATVSYGSIWYCDGIASVGVDATPEVREAAEAWKRASEAEAAARAERYREWASFFNVRPNGRVNVVRGRKCKGKSGIAIRKGPYGGWLVEIDETGEQVWIDESNIRRAVTDEEKAQWEEAGREFGARTAA